MFRRQFQLTLPLPQNLNNRRNKIYGRRCAVVGHQLIPLAIKEHKEWQLTKPVALNKEVRYVFLAHRDIGDAVQSQLDHKLPDLFHRLIGHHHNLNGAQFGEVCQDIVRHLMAIGTRRREIHVENGGIRRDIAIIKSRLIDPRHRKGWELRKGLHGEDTQHTREEELSFHRVMGLVDIG